MCGIFGLYASKGSELSYKFAESTLKELFRLSESRGKEASGLAFTADKNLYLYKKQIPASSLIKSDPFKNYLTTILKNNFNYHKILDSPLSIIGHSRLVTNGSLENNKNNQPVLAGSIVGVHNGIVTNDLALWGKFPSIDRKYEIDTEIIFSLIDLFSNERKKGLIDSVVETFSFLEGSASIALINKRGESILATNTGSLYYCLNKSNTVFIFASERIYLEEIIRKNKISDHTISKINPGSGCYIDPLNFTVLHFDLCDKESYRKLDNVEKKALHNIIDLSCTDYKYKKESGSLGKRFKPYNMRNLYDGELSETILQNNEIFDSLRRCTKCILPETAPNIIFDEDGVCNYCKDYQNLKIKGPHALEKYISKFRKNSDRPDCLVAFSGGRDSSYALHYIKTKLDLNPLAFTYDWGMITDLARRNQARICGKLGIEHIIFSANLEDKRRNIKLNVDAWLKRPELGMVPLFMAGDKFFFYYSNMLKKKYGLVLEIWAGNKLEKSFFKTGFAGVKERSDDTASGNRTYLDCNSKVKLTFYYIKNIIMNLSYLNPSIYESMLSYMIYFILPHNYLRFSDYIKWDEQEIISTLRNEYDWETARDTTTTWRIGDGTAAFYNYIYNTVAGFTENDTLRSNQIRENIISREKALKMVREENINRYDSIKEYCGVIGVDFCKMLNVVESIPKLYSNKIR